MKTTWETMWSFSFGFVVAMLSNLKTILILAFVSLVAGCGSDDAPTQKQENSAVQAMEESMSKEDLKAFAGKEHISLDGELGEIVVQQSEVEKKYLAGNLCDDCDQEAKFLDYIKKTYPDVFKVKFKPTKDISSDKETYNMYRTSFYMGLYFAKQIKLADGGNLFDFLTNCSKSISPLNSAQLGFDDKQNKYIYLQYFPVLLHKESGKEDEMNVIFNRYGDKITANSKLFSTSILKHQDYMDRHGLTCRK